MPARRAPAERRLLDMAPQISLTQIDPDLPVVWEDPTTIRVGFDRALARLPAEEPGAQAVVARLIRGASDTELARSDSQVVEHALSSLTHVLVHRTAPAGTVAAEETGDSSAAASAASSAALQPAPRNPAPATIRRAAAKRRWGDRHVQAPQFGGASAVMPESARRPPTARLFDDGIDVPWLRETLGSSSECVLRREAKPPDLAVQVLRFLEPLGRTARWLRAGVPQLIIRFSDGAARVGPLVTPDGAPCHGCEMLHLTDADPALPAVASQLYGARPSSETGEVSQVAATAAVHFVRAWRRGEPWVHDRQLELPVAHGKLQAFPRLRQLRTHPECGCALSDPPQPRAQTSTAGARHEPRSRTPTATARRERA